jgi:hypothetical protein
VRIGPFTFSGGFQLSVTNLVDWITAFSSRGADGTSVSLGGRGSSAFLPSADTSVGGWAVYALSTGPSPWGLGDEAIGRPVTAPGQHNEGEIKEEKKKQNQK